MPIGRVAIRTHFPRLQQRMSLPHHTDKAVAEKRLQADLRPHPTKDANLQIDPPFAQRRGIFFGFRDKTETHARCDSRHRVN